MKGESLLTAVPRLAVGALGFSESVVVEQRCLGLLEVDVLPIAVVRRPTMDWRGNVVDLGLGWVGVRVQVGCLRVFLLPLPGFVGVLPMTVAHCWWRGV